MSSYDINSSTQLMENQLAAQALESQSALAVTKTADGQVLLFSIDQAQTLRATICQDGSATGWTTQAISGAIPAPAGTLTVKTFAATQAAVPAGDAPAAITLLVAVTLSTPGGARDLVYVTSLAADAAASWVTDPASISWTPRPFDFTSPQFPQLGPTNLNVADIMLATISAAAPFGVVTVVDPGDGIDRPFAIDLTPADTSDLWNYMEPEQDYTELLASAPGHPAGTLMAGIYKLYTYTSNDQPELSLTFKPTAPQFPARFFQITPNATTLAAVAPLAGAGNSFTTLLVADGGAIVVYPWNDTTQNQQSFYVGTAAATNPQGSTILTEVSALQAVADGSLLSVWGLNGSGQIFYLQASIDGSGSLSNWTAPLPVLSNVLRAAPYLSETRQFTTLYAVVLDPTTQDETLYELSRDPLSGGGWTKCQIQLPATDAYVTLSTYTTRVQVIDTTNNNTPAPVTVQITASRSVFLQINGFYYTLNPSQPVSLATDPTGSFTLMQVLSGLGAPTYFFAVIDQSSNQPLPPISVDPTTGVRSQLATYTTGQQLLAAQTTTTQGQTQPLLNAVPPATADQLASGIQTLSGIAPAAVQWPPSGDLGQAPPNESLESILVDLADLVLAVQEFVFAVGASTLFTIINDVTSGQWQLTVQIEGTLYSAVISSAEDVANAVGALFNAVLTTFEDVFRWLAFLFDWDNILTIQQALVSLYTVALDNAPDLVTAAMKTLSAWITYVSSSIESRFASLVSQLLSQVPDQTLGQLLVGLQTSSSPPMVPSTDPRLYWGQPQVAAPLPGNGGSGTTDPLAEAGATTPLAEALTNVVNSIIDVAPQWRDALVGLSDSTVTLRAALATVLDTPLNLINGIDTVVDLAVDELASIFPALSSELTSPLQIPLFTALYSDITEGETLTVLGLFCLIQAVPCTVIYGVATNGNGQAADFLPASQIQEIDQTLAHVAGGLPQPPSQQARAVDSPFDNSPTAGGRRIVPEILAEDSGLFVIRGVLHLARTYTTVWVSLGDFLEDPGPQGSGPAGPMLAKAYLADGCVWMFEGLIGLVQENSGLQIISIGLLNTLAGCGQIYIRRAISKETLGWTRAGASFIIGVDEVWYGVRSAGEDTATFVAEVAYGLNEVLELGQELVGTSNAIVYFAIVAVRCVLMLVTSGVDFASA